MATPLQSPQDTTSEDLPVLIPKLPNEISMMIIRELGFVDLLVAYFTNLRWREVIDKDETTCQKLFRPPSNIRNASNEEQAQYVAEQRQSIYDKHATDESVRPKSNIIIFPKDDNIRPDPDYVWHDVAFNPLFQPESPLTFSTYYDGSQRRKPSDVFKPINDPNSWKEVVRLPSVPAGMEQELTRFWGSMFVTWPPLIRVGITLFNEIERLWDWRQQEEYVLLSFSGMSMGALYYHTREVKYLHMSLMHNLAYESILGNMG
ncbi:hypothetical protein BKA63DRAFT_569423 [Paraphoma chrysanthemicola]|nr:hypothetical protein BKA63DRAFT_569423 [Paraphoma chrysanthemicola]